MGDTFHRMLLPTLALLLARMAGAAAVAVAAETGAKGMCAVFAGVSVGVSMHVGPPSSGSESSGSGADAAYCLRSASVNAEAFNHGISRDK